MPVTGVLGIELGKPFVQRVLNDLRVHFPNLSFGPIPISVFPSFEKVEQFFNGGSGDLGSERGFGSLGENPPNSTGSSIPAVISQGVLGMTLDGVIPVADVHTAFRTVSQVHRNEAQVGREKDG